MEKTLRGASSKDAGDYRLKLSETAAWISLGILMVFYAGTWSSPFFYHITEKYNSLIVFAALFLLFVSKASPLSGLKSRDPVLWITGITILLALVNLFIVGSGKGAILILADFLLIIAMSSRVCLTELQRKVLSVFFLLMYFSWFVYDRAFSYNSNTGATYTVFTLFGAMIALKQLTDRREFYGVLMVMAFLRTGTLVLWHLARGAFLALFFFGVFWILFTKLKLDRHPRLYFALCVFSVFGSLLFVFSYVQLSKTGFNAQLPFFYKNIFSGREQIWAEVWEMLKSHPLTGIGSGYKLESFFEYNIHNAMYDILIVHGATVFALSAWVIIRRLLEGRKYISCSVSSQLAASAVFAVFFESFIDMDLMWADYSPVILFLFLEVFRGKQDRL